MAIRDFVPAGEELTGEEKSRFGLREQEAGIQRPNDFVPGDGAFEDRTREEKEQFARDAAIKSASRFNSVRTAEADRKMKDLTVNEANDFLESLSERDRQVYLQAEKDGLNRSGIFDRHGEPEGNTPTAEGAIVPFGAVADASDSYTATPGERPTVTTSPSDRLHRAIRAHQEGEDVDTDPLTPHEERTVDDSDEGQHYPGDPDDDGIVEEAVAPPNAPEADEEDGPDWAAINAAKAREAAAGERIEPGTEVEPEESDGPPSNPNRDVADEPAGAAQTGPEQADERHGYESDAPVEASSATAGGEKQDKVEQPVTADDVKKAKKDPHVQSNKALKDAEKDGE